MDRYAEYKESGAEWLGMIPRDWPMLFLSQIAMQVKNKNTDLEEQNLLSLSYGRIKRKPIDTNGGLLPASFDGYNIIEKNDIVLRLTDLQNDHTSLRVGLSPERGIITSAYVTLRPRDEDTASYLYYALHTFDIRKGLYGMGSGVRQGLNYEEVKKIQIPFPSKLEQTAIAAYLDDKVAQIDTLIAEAKASIEEYKAWKASIIYEAVTKGLDPTVEMKDSGVPWIGSIPYSWSLRKIDAVADVTKLAGFEFTNYFEYVPDGSVIAIRGLNLKNISLDLTSVQRIHSTVSQMLPRSQIHINDILVSYAGTVGAIAVVPDDGNTYHLAPNVGKITLTEKNMNARFIAYYLVSYAGQMEIDLRKNKNAQESISMANIRKIQFTCPDYSQQCRIVGYLDQKVSVVDSYISEKESLISDLEAYKKSLIFEVVTGKRKVV